MRVLRSRRYKKGGLFMSNGNKFRVREWLVPPILLPILLALFAAAALIPW
jgi:hypothetical protein